MRTSVYPTLTTGKKVLWTLKLLRSANIYTYPVSRVRAVAVDVFGLDSNQWDDAFREVQREGFVRTEKRQGKAEMRIAPIADVYLDEAISDYPLPGASLSDDWEELEACLKRSKDASALTSLGGAFLGETSLDPFERNQHAERCCLAAFEELTREEAPTNWAATQNLLGLALLGQSEGTSGEAKAELEDQAIAAFNAAMAVFTQEQAPAGWMLLQNHLTNALSVKVGLPTGTTRTTGTLGDLPSVPWLIEGDKKALSVGAIINLNLLEPLIPRIAQRDVGIKRSGSRPHLVASW